ncbi:MAG: WG repeat-containing protein [Acholeplasmataceae bacterium]|nr:WG repeat-containing protein [Acholeplasmataceae bacterium]
MKYDGKWWFVDKSGKEFMPLAYEAVGNLSEGLARAKRNNNWGFIDKNNYDIIPLVYDDVGDFHEGLAAVCFDGMWGFIDKNGKNVIPLKYNRVESFNAAGEAKVEQIRRTGMWSAEHRTVYINKKGKEISIPQVRQSGRPKY